MVLTASAAGHQDRDCRPAGAGDLRLGSIDGTVIRMPDTPANRAEFGSASGDGGDASPYPQLRDLLVTDASPAARLSRSGSRLIG
jgi:hypothetical protein